MKNPPRSSSEVERLLRCAELTTLGRLRSASNVVLLCELVIPGPDGDALRCPPQAGGAHSSPRAASRPTSRPDTPGVSSPRISESDAHDGPEEFLCVYKPVRGERPLWDFPEASLAGREVASYLVSEALGWALVPPTVLRDGPYGSGMLQQWVRSVESSETEASARGLVGFFLRDQVPTGWRAVVLGSDEDGEEVALAHADHPRLRQLAVLDVLLNNADRKGGHVLLDQDSGVWGIDHGVCFHEDPKLRTVLWGWAGAAIPADQLADVERVAAELDGPLGEVLSEYLTEEEIVALAERAGRLLVEQVMPSPRGERALPWPLM